MGIFPKWGTPPHCHVNVNVMFLRKKLWFILHFRTLGTFIVGGSPMLKTVKNGSGIRDSLIITQWLVMPRWHWLWVHPTTSPLHTSDLNPANLSWHQSLLVSSQFPHLLSYQLLYCAHLFSNLNLLRHMYLFVDPLHHTANESTSESNPLHLALTWFVRGTETSFPNIAEYSRPPVPKLPSNLCLAHASLPYGALNLFISLKEKVKGRLNIGIFGCI